MALLRFDDQNGLFYHHTPPGAQLTPTLIVEDIVRLCAELGPARPILVGLSSGWTGRIAAT